MEDIFSAIDYRPPAVRKGKVPEGNRSTTIPPHERIDYQVRILIFYMYPRISNAEISGYS